MARMLLPSGSKFITWQKAKPLVAAAFLGRLCEAASASLVSMQLTHQLGRCARKALSFLSGNAYTKQTRRSHMYRCTLKKNWDLKSVWVRGCFMSFTPLYLNSKTLRKNWDLKSVLVRGCFRALYQHRMPLVCHSIEHMSELKYSNWAVLHIFELSSMHKIVPRRLLNATNETSS